MNCQFEMRLFLIDFSFEHTGSCVTAEFFFIHVTLRYNNDRHLLGFHVCSCWVESEKSRRNCRKNQIRAAVGDDGIKDDLSKNPAAPSVRNRWLQHMICWANLGVGLQKQWYDCCEIRRVCIKGSKRTPQFLVFYSQFHFRQMWREIQPESSKLEIIWLWTAGDWF